MDTNIYDTFWHNFRNSQLRQLAEYGQEGMLELQINAVVKGEVRRHIKRNVTSAMDKLLNTFQSRELTLFRELDWYEDVVRPLDKAAWVQDAYSEFD